MIRKIINGLVVDGSGSEPFLGGIEIKNGLISRVLCGPSRDETTAAGEVFDAQGMVITPGFVDIHRHHDIAALYDPDFGTAELSQGITTAVCGNCGLGAFPNDPQTASAQFRYIEPCLGKMPAGCTFHTFPEYLDALERKKLPLHVAAFIGAGAVAATVMGYAHRGFTLQEREKASSLVEEAMPAGAVGLSFGIMYEPECYLSEDDQVAMASACARNGGMVSCHIRGEGDSLVSSVQEIIRICAKAGVPLNISHFKATGVRNWGKEVDQAIAVIEEARSRGQIVTCDAYPYTAGATTALSLIPPSVLEGRELSFLASPEGIRRLGEEIGRPQPGWDNMVESIGWERVIIGSVTLEKNRICCGRNVSEIASGLGYSDPCEWFGPFVAEEEGKVGIIIMSMSQEDVDKVLALPYCALISDSLYGGGDNPHPRLYGSFPRFIREYVREKKLLTLPQAIEKMTYMPAKRVGLTDRGLLEEGFAADAAVFDPLKITDRATYSDPKQLSDGIALVLVEGQKALVNSQRTGNLAGHVLRKPKSTHL